VKDQLYYDGTCPLCSKEISLLKSSASEYVDFIDIQTVDSSQEKHPSREKLLKRLHLRKNNGEWLIGLDANVHVWSFSRFGFFLKILRWPLIRDIADFFYCTWADRRYEKRYGCESCTL